MRYRALGSIDLPEGRKPPGSEFDADPRDMAELLAKKMVEEADDTVATPDAADANTLTGELATIQAALDQQVTATQVAEAQRDAAEARAQQAEAELAALRAQAAPPSESLPPEEPPPEEPPGKAKAKKTAEAK